MRHRTAAVFLCIVLTCATAAAGCAGGQSRTDGGAELHLVSGGLTRTYILHVPPSYDGSRPYPLVIAYHGHGGDGAGQERVSGMDATADANGFLVAYPNGISKGWNDGRSSGDTSVDDVGFTSDLIARISSTYSVDASRVFATGLSNGGMMCYRIAMDLHDQVAAVAPVAALLSQYLAGRTPNPRPISVMVTAGTNDPLMPYNGGAVGLVLKTRGNVLSAADTISFWTKADACNPTPATTSINKDPNDGTSVKVDDYTGGTNGAEVMLYTVDGGGHAWPGGVQYARPRLIGVTSRDYSASQAIWDFFARHTLGR